MAGATDIYTDVSGSPSVGGSARRPITGGPARNAACAPMVPVESAFVHDAIHGNHPWTQWPLRVCVPLMAMIVLFVVAVFAIVIPMLQHGMLDRKREMIRRLTDSAESILTYYADQEADGSLTREEAQARAIAHVRQMRYGPDMSDYFWIQDMHPRMIMHPIRADIDGEDLTHRVDPHGTPLYTVFADTVREHGAGFVDSVWHGEHDENYGLPQLVYVNGFEPWGWVVGTGVDVADVAAVANRLVKPAMGILVAVSVLSFIIIAHAARTDAGRQRAERALRQSERNYREIFNATSDAIFIHDAGSGAIVDVNQTMLDMYGFSREQALQATTGECSAGDAEHAQAQAVEWIHKAVREGSQVFEWHARHHNGDHFWVEVALRLSEIGGEGRVLAVVRNIDARKKAEDALRKSEAKFATAFHASPDSVTLTSVDDGSFIDVNRGFERITGYHAGDVLHRDVLDVGLWVDPMERAAMRREVERNGYVRDFEMRLRTKSGAVRDCQLSADIIELDGRQCLLAVTRDITDRKLAEEHLRVRSRQLQAQNTELEAQRQQLRALNMELEMQKQQLKAQQIDLVSVNDELRRAIIASDAANRAKSEFLANMSHEIRTPMNSILGYVDVLLGHGDLTQAPEERIEAIRTVQRNGDHLLGIINSILDLSKIEAGQMSLERLSCSPCEVVSDVASLSRIRAADKQIAFSIEYTGPMPETIVTDPTRLRQILINLVGNAVKFTDRGSVRLVVTLCRADSPNPLLQFDVIDTGPGMSAEQVEQVFEPFTQADTSTTRRFGGTGLGLTISRQLARLLGGDVRIIETGLGSGTHIRLTVATGPLNQINLIDDPEARTGASEMETLSVDVDEGKPLDSRRVLLAEDGIDNQRLVAHLLGHAGADVTVVENGQLALDAVAAARDGNKPFDIILMDMQMPVLDGYEATRSLRKGGCTLPIIALTAHAMAGDREKCLQAGCTDYAPKPVSRKRLIQIIRAHVRAAATTTEAAAWHS
jgi:PAS domain S-box-containing protein